MVIITIWWLSPVIKLHQLVLYQSALSNVILCQAVLVCVQWGKVNHLTSSCSLGYRGVILKTAIRACHCRLQQAWKYFCDHSLMLTGFSLSLENSLGEERVKMGYKFKLSMCHNWQSSSQWSEYESVSLKHWFSLSIGICPDSLLSLLRVQLHTHVKAQTTCKQIFWMGKLKCFSI